MRKLVYIAGPYSANTKEAVKANIQKADAVAKKVLLAGFIPITPHKISSFFDLDPRFADWTENDWLNNFCLPLLDQCHAIAMVEGWSESKGATIEFNHALSQGMQIYPADYWTSARPETVSIGGLR